MGGKPLGHFYDQIAWFTEEKDGTKPLLSLSYTGKSGDVRLESDGARGLRPDVAAEVVQDLGPLSAVGRVRCP